MHIEIHDSLSVLNWTPKYHFVLWSLIKGQIYWLHVNNITVLHSPAMRISR